MKSLIPLALAGAAIFAAALPAQDAPIDIEKLISAPFPSGTTSSPSRAGWLSLERGRRSIYLVNPATGLATRVAHFPKDDGQDFSSLDISDDGLTVAFVRGQGYNLIRENPNPSSDPRGAEQAVWVSRAGVQRRIGRGSSPSLSPDGRWVVYQLDSTLMIGSTTAAGPARPLFRGRGINGDAQWSPDGRAVAFTSARGDHAFIGVYHRIRDSIAWMAPGVDRDANPRWSADGKRIAFTRTPGGGSGGGGGGGPGGGGSRGFGVWMANVDSGTATRIWHSEPGPRGRLHNPTSGRSFLWSGRHLLFFMERDDFQHLYSLATDSGMTQPRQLTKGECEAEEPSTTADGAWVYFSSNCSDIDRKHLWRARVDGSVAAEQLTQGASIEYAPAVSGSHVFFLRGDAKRPPAPALMSLAGKAVTVRGAPALPAGFPVNVLVEPQPVTFKAADGMTIHGQLFLPKGAAKAPAVIFTHGGPSRQMLLGWHPRGYYNRAYAFNQHLASKGYAVLSVNYRGGVGYGRLFREAPNRGRNGSSEYQDVVAGAKYLQSLPTVDPQRIGLWGGSYGGYLTALGMGRNPEIFKSGVDLHGVHDMNTSLSAPQLVAGTRETDSIMARVRVASPVCCIADIRGPLLLIQGDDDRNVSFGQTVSYAQMLRNANKPFELMIFPDEVHDFLRWSNWLKVYRASADFFDRTLMRGEKLASQ